MKKLKGYESAKPYSEQERLPAGGYILRVLNVEYQENDWGDVIILSFDIAEGEYKGFYNENYENQASEDKKWKGNYRLRVPADDGADEDAWKQRRFKTIIAAFEDSNNGFHWDWDEQKLKGKVIGGIFNNKEYDYNGHTGFFTNCHSLTPVEKIRSGKFKIPEDTLLRHNEGAAQAVDNNGWMNVPDGIDENLPFN